jgi:hypothetical protein
MLTRNKSDYFALPLAFIYSCDYTPGTSVSVLGSALTVIDCNPSGLGT